MACQQRGIAARHRLLDAKPDQVMRPAGFRTGSRQAFPAEGLHADHRADDVAVDINVADMRRACQRLRARIDARLQAQRQAVAERALICAITASGVFCAPLPTQRTICSTGPKMSSLTSARLANSNAAGATVLRRTGLAGLFLGACRT